jgi:hypothetical protein
MLSHWPRLLVIGQYKNKTFSQMLLLLIVDVESLAKTSSIGQYKNKTSSH